MFDQHLLVKEKVRQRTGGPASSGPASIGPDSIGPDSIGSFPNALASDELVLLLCKD